MGTENEKVAGLSKATLEEVVRVLHHVLIVAGHEELVYKGEPDRGDFVILLKTLGRDAEMLLAALSVEGIDTKYKNSEE